MTIEVNSTLTLKVNIYLFLCVGSPVHFIVVCVCVCESQYNVEELVLSFIYHMDLRD